MSFFDRVLDHAQRRPDAPCFHFISRREPEVSRTFGDVVRDAGHAAERYAEEGVRAGDVVVLVGTHHPDFYAAWLGAVWLGAVPSVMAEPSVRIDRGVYFERLAALLDRIRARVVATSEPVDGLPLGSTRVLHYTNLCAAGAHFPRIRGASDDELLLLQHSSGTTGLQKGVMLSHGAVTRHANAYAEAIGLGERDVVASWLPLYHDMGLIACFVGPLLAGIPVAWISPFEWVTAPGLLLEAVTKHRATLAWLPNFAFSFLSQRVRSAPGALDLSSLRAVVNCSEPVTAEAMDAFASRFARDGLRPEALAACYAMAENVFAVTTSRPGLPPARRRVSRAAWLERHVATAPAADEPDVTHVSSGTAVPSCEVRIVDGDGARVEALHAGRVLIHSEFLFDGYYRRDDLNASLFDENGFYDTGDLGYLDERGELFVTGRAKDLAIIGGRNVYPQDVENAVAEVTGVYPGRVVVFGVPVRGLGTEALVVLVESELDEAKWNDIVLGIRRAVPSKLDLDVGDARVVPRNTLRKSTSGKLARTGNRQWYLEGRFGPVPGHFASDEPASA